MAPAGSTGRFSFSPNGIAVPRKLYEDALVDYAWFGGNAKGMPHPVGQKFPNAWGLYDMHGNVWERCLDSRDADGALYYAGSPVDDPCMIRPGHEHIHRGGGFSCPARICRSANRSHNGPWWNHESGIGMRVCMVFTGK